MFLGLRPPLEQVRSWFHTTRQAFGDASALHWLAPEDVHLTVRFLGGVDAVQEARLIDALVAGLDGQAAFDAETRQSMWFPDISQPVVLAVAVLLDPMLAALAARVNAAAALAGVPPDPRPFHPHISLARLGRRGLRGLPAAPDLPAARFSVFELILFESLGNKVPLRYRPRRVFRFV
ncbi:MAG TPA: RNA 2',3'-cyclic phosphodiesterase [Candidatus Acidoferrales bacterium]|nr:RNA 2',3'-cyclic phosphodiesterase [Candidatus Acidoferrales bacterium]